MSVKQAIESAGCFVKTAAAAEAVPAFVIKTQRNNLQPAALTTFIQSIIRSNTCLLCRPPFKCGRGVAPQASPKFVKFMNSKGDVVMMYSLSRQSLPDDFNQRMWQSALRAISVVGREAEPAIFAHFQPHAHATARLARHFAAYVCEGEHRLHWLEEIEFGAHVHDIGKYFIAPDILLKPDQLDEEERKTIALHSVYGAVIISQLPAVTETIRRIVLHHHEHWDGTGYPEGLSGAAISLEARIVSVVDVYTSLRARRSYKPSFTKADALKELVEMAGRELDPNLVEDFIRLYGGSIRK
jgi:HD-GYP domain-containing protein (c-di-GMP phosphodiesterase class II)